MPTEEISVRYTVRVLRNMVLYSFYAAGMVVAAVITIGAVLETVRWLSGALLP